MSYEELHVHFTCGLCEMPCDDYVDHPCLSDYGDIHLDENYYVYPLSDDKETIIRRGILPDGSEGLIEDSIYGNKENTCQNLLISPTTTTPTTKNQSKRRKLTAPKTNRKKLSDADVEHLIIEVQVRIPSWNSNIPVEERSRETQAKLWEEVAAALNGKISAAEAKIKFKSIRNTYRRIIQSEYRASGSAAVTSQDQWKFYNCCEFLRDTCLIRNTSSNVTQGSVTDDGNADIDSSIDDTFSETGDEDLGRSQACGVVGNGQKRRRSNKDDAIDSASALNRIADALCRENVPLTLPEPPKIDTVGAFLIGIGNQIRQLPQQGQIDIIKQFTDIVYEAVKHC
ncbi:uncharacterized protein LOC125502124 [Athalia rosae]|uniref:uncharacterized protein LOC125502124 n=1 Tax=Athalia rosae TaxID=37344 RepID=UPI002034970E|nr:uncharacterized protein LOC125502124 [Athalia rosae]